jgi:hypothetical protein
VAASPPANPAVQQVVQGVVRELLDGAPDVAAYARAYNAQQQGSSGGSGSGSLRQQAAAAEMLALLDPGSKAASVRALLADAPTADAVAAGNARQLLADAVEVHKLLLAGPLADAAAAFQWQGACAAAFPRAAYWGGASATPLSALNLDPAQLKQPAATPAAVN